MEEKERRLHNLLADGDLQAIQSETEHIASLIVSDFESHLFHSIVSDINRLFHGEYPGYKSELELLKKTEQFHRSVVQVRLTDDFGNVARAMHNHFRVRWGIDRDLYTDAIAINIEHLNSIDETCADISCWYETRLRRGGLICRVMEKEK